MTDNLPVILGVALCKWRFTSRLRVTTLRRLHCFSSHSRHQKTSCIMHDAWGERARDRLHGLPRWFIKGQWLWVSRTGMYHAVASVVAVPQLLGWLGSALGSWSFSLKSFSGIRRRWSYYQVGLVHMYVEHRPHCLIESFRVTNTGPRRT